MSGSGKKLLLAAFEDEPAALLPAAAGSRMAAQACSTPAVLGD